MVRHCLAQIWQKEPLSVPAISLRPVTYWAFIRAFGAYLTSAIVTPSAASFLVANTLPKCARPSECPLSWVMIE
jgi:hypothetical protein